MHVLLINWSLERVPQESIPDCRRRIATVLASWEIYEPVDLVPVLDASLRGAIKIRCVQFRDSYFKRPGAVEMLDKEIASAIGGFLDDHQIPAHFDPPEGRHHYLH